MFDGQDYWTRLDEIESTPPGNDETFCVIGSGETAAAIVVDLISRRPNSTVIVMNRQGTIFSRGEGFHENRLFTEPTDDWRALPERAKKEVIGRADRGVFSLDTVRVVNHAAQVKHMYADVKSISITDDYGERKLEVLFEGYDPDTGVEQELEVPANFVIVAKGFDPWSFSDFFEDSSLLPESDRGKLQAGIRFDLSLPLDRAGVPRIHVPMLAGVAQGPGFPNLSALGSVADRILRSYIDPPPVVQLFPRQAAI